MLVNAIIYFSFVAIACTINPKDDPFFKYEVMQELPGGYFTFGSDRSDFVSDGDVKYRQMFVKPFLIDKYPVNNEHFGRYMEKNKKKIHTTADSKGYSYVYKEFVQKGHIRNYKILKDNQNIISVQHANWERPEGLGTYVGDMKVHPVVQVSFHDAMQYCVSKGKRLPTEYEWEFASRGGLPNHTYPWGSRIFQKRMNFREEDKKPQTLPVNNFPAQNSYGIYDMLGNVWEWTSTTFRNSFTDTFDPSEKVIRGGSFLDPLNKSRITMRTGVPSSVGIHNLGFRCALSKHEGESSKVDKVYLKNEL